MRCLMPIAASPASYIPGVKLARGSAESEPVIPAGRGGAGAGANGFAPPFWLAGLVSGAFVGGGVEGEGEGVCACVLIEKQQHKTSEANSVRKAILYTRFIVSPPKSFPSRWFAQRVCGIAESCESLCRQSSSQNGLHNPDLSALATVDIRREIEQFGILARTRSVEQV